MYNCMWFKCIDWNPCCVCECVCVIWSSSCDWGEKAISFSRVCVCVFITSFWKRAPDGLITRDFITQPSNYTTTNQNAERGHGIYQVLTITAALSICPSSLLISPERCVFLCVCVCVSSHFREKPSITVRCLTLMSWIFMSVYNLSAGHLYQLVCHFSGTGLESPDL